MKRISACASAVAFFGMSFNFAVASEPNSWVSGTGTDAGTCTVTAPCATLQYAYKQTTSNGTINIATSGSYGTLEMTRPVNVVAAEGIDALIQVPPSVVGVYDKTTGVVLLKGLHIVGSSLNLNVGIGFSVNGNLIIDHVTITNVDSAVTVSDGFTLVKSSVLVGNRLGLTANGNLVFVGQSTISGNAVGAVGTINSYGDNDMNGNTTCDVCQVSITEVPHDL